MGYSTKYTQLHDADATSVYSIINSLITYYKANTSITTDDGYPSGTTEATVEFDRLAQNYYQGDRLSGYGLFWHSYSYGTDDSSGNDSHKQYSSEQVCSFTLPDGTFFTPTLPGFNLWYVDENTRELFIQNPAPNYTSASLSNDLNTLLRQTLSSQDVSQLSADSINFIVDNYNLAGFLNEYLTQTQIPSLSASQIAGLNYNAMQAVLGIVGDYGSTLQTNAVSAQDPFGSGVLASFTVDQTRAWANWLPSVDVYAGSVHYKTLYSYDSHHEFLLDDSTYSALSAVGQQYLAVNHLAWLSEAMLATIPNTVISQIIAEQFVELSQTQLAAFTAGQISAISSDQIAALGHTLNQFTSEQLAGLVPSQVEHLTPQQWDAFTPGQFSSLEGDISSSNLTSTNLSNRDITFLTPTEIAVLSPSFFAEMSGDQIAVLSAKQVWAMTSAQLAVILDKINRFNSTAVLGLSAGQIAALGSNPTYPNGIKPLLSMNSDEISYVESTQLSQVLDSIFGSLTLQQLSGLTSTQILNMNSTQYLVLNSAQVQALATVPVEVMAPTQIAALTTSQIAALLPVVIGALTVQQWRALSTEQIRALSVSQIAKIPASTLNLLGSAILSAFSETQLQGLSIDALMQLNPTVANYLTFMKGLTAAQINAVSLAAAGTYSNPTIPTNIRNVYSTATSIRTIAAFLANYGYGSTMGYSASEFSYDVRGAGYLKESFARFGEEINDTRSAHQGVRLIGSAMALSAAADSFYQASAATSNQTQLTLNVMQGLGWLASALQVPIAVAYAAYKAHLEGESSSDAFLGQVGLGNYFEMLRMNNEQGVEELIGEYHQGDQTRSAPDEEIVSEDVSTEWKALKPFSEQMNNAWKSEGVFFVADLFSLANSAYGIYNATKSQDIIGTIGSSLNLITGTVGTIGDALPLFAEGADLAKAASKFLGSAAIAGLVIGDILGIYNDVQAYKQDPTTGKLVAAVGDGITDTVQLSIIIGALAFGGPIGAAVGAAAALLLPNFSAIGQAIDLAQQQSTLDSEGRYAEGDIISHALHTIAALNATPIINLFGAAYTSKIMSDLYSAMSDHGMLQALGEDLHYQLRGTAAGIAAAQKLMGYVAAMRGTAQEISDIENITLNSADKKIYYASANSALTNYITDLDATASDCTSSVSDLMDESSTNIFTVTLSTTGSASSSKIVEINGVDDGRGRLLIDASQISQSVQYIINSGNVTINAGTGKAVYLVNENNLATDLINARAGSGSVVQIVNHNNATSNSIALDQVTNAVVRASTEVANNTVTGTKSGQIYYYGGGLDAVSMTGGMGTAEVGGKGTNVTMGGGNNLMYAVLGYSPFGSSVPSSTAGVYNGGSTVASQVDSQGNLLYSGMNTINFSASAEELNIEINDPSSSNNSTVTTISGNIADNAKFRNFQNIVGSNLGDKISISSCTTLGRVLLGLGNNDVDINNSSGLKLISGISDNNIDIRGTSSVEVHTIGGSDDIVLSGSSSITGYLSGAADLLDASNDDATSSISVDSQLGNHSIFLADQQAAIAVDSASSNSLTAVYDQVQMSRTHAIDLTLGSDMSHELVARDDAHNMLKFYSTDGTNQELDFVSLAGLAGESVAIISGANAVGDFSKTDIGVDQLIQALASTSVLQSTINFGAGVGRSVSGYNLASLIAGYSH